VPITRSQFAFALGLENGERSNREAQRSDRIIQVPREDAVPVMDQVLVIVSVSDPCSELLQRPGRTRVGRHVHVRQTPRAVLDDDEHVQHPKRRGRRLRREDLRSSGGSPVRLADPVDRLLRGIEFIAVDGRSGSISAIEAHR